jgi:hypothetical protein
MDVRAAMARVHHHAAAQQGELADRERAQRDRLVRELRREDPDTWTYTALAKAVGCSPELIAYIIRNEPSPPQG